MTNGARNPLFDLSGRTALVTGSARGLGFQIAVALGQAGAKIAINGRNEVSLRKAASYLRNQGVDVETFQADLTTEGCALVDRVIQHYGQLDILVNNVGNRDRRPTRAMPPSGFRELLEVNLVAGYALSREAIEHLMASPNGRLIFVTSIAGPIARAGDPAYTASKGGLASLMRSMAVEFGKTGPTVNAIAPGWFSTEANAEYVGLEQIEQFIQEHIPLARWGRPEEIGAAAVFLASDAASYVNGLTLTVDGGLSVSF